jgi:hypothetical protein
MSFIYRKLKKDKQIMDAWKVEKSKTQEKEEVGERR